MIISAAIVLTRTSDEKMLLTLPFDSELQAQEKFDELAQYGSEYQGHTRLDLEVTHMTEGKLCRRTMYIND